MEFPCVKLLRDLARRNKPLSLNALWRRYIVALGLIFGLLLVSHVFSRQALEQGASDAYAINLSGSQRMLLQQIAYTAHNYAESHSERDRKTLVEASNRFRANHYKLAELARANPALHELYFEEPTPLNHEILVMLGHAGWVIAAPQSAGFAVDALEEAAHGELADDLNRAVKGFEAKAHLQSAKLTAIQNMSLFAAVLTIFGEILMIFWPAHQTLKRAFKGMKSEHEQTQAALERLSNFASVAADLFWETDLKGNITYSEGPLHDRMKGGRRDTIGCHYLDIIKYDEENLEKIQKLTAGLESYSKMAGTMYDADGRAFRLSLSGKPRRDASGKVIGYLGTADDVTKHVEEREAIEKLALTDALTGLANKRGFEKMLDADVRAAQPDAPVYLLAIDLDRFKAVNDTYGHGAGDELLKAVAGRMRSEIREGDWIARTGGDEFFVVCRGAPSVDAVRGLAWRLNEKLAQPFRLSVGNDVRISASIGVAWAPEHATSIAHLVEAADIALYDAKHTGKNKTRLYRPVSLTDWGAQAS